MEPGLDSVPGLLVGSVCWDPGLVPVFCCTSRHARYTRAIVLIAQCARAPAYMRTR